MRRIRLHSAGRQRQRKPCVGLAWNDLNEQDHHPESGCQHNNQDNQKSGEARHLVSRSERARTVYSE